MSQVCIAFSHAGAGEACAALCQAAGLAVTFASPDELARVAPERRFALIVLACEDPRPRLEALRGVDPAVRVIAVVPVALPAEEAEALRRAGANSVVFWPHSPQTLRKAIHDELPAPRLGEELNA
jgi:hypothetical protein